jgi:hypothetical protein
VLAETPTLNQISLAQDSQRQIAPLYLNGNGMLDIVAPGKEGLFVFENLGPS